MKTGGQHDRSPTSGYTCQSLMTCPESSFIFPQIRSIAEASTTFSYDITEILSVLVIYSILLRHYVGHYCSPEEEYVRKQGSEAKYEELLNQNSLLSTLYLIKERLSLAYIHTDEAWIADDIAYIMDTCVASKNEF